MPTSTYIALANLTLTQADAVIDFTSIPNTYRDLVLIVSNSIQNDVYLQFNNDTGSNYSWVWGGGQNSGVQNGSNGTSTFAYTGWNGLGVNHINIMDYSATDKHKAVLSRSGSAGNSIVQMVASRWANMNAITAIKLTNAAGDFPIGSNFALYGIVS